MSRLTKCLCTGMLLSALLLSGCGNKAQEETIPVASPDSAETTAVQSFTGKIISISGNEITLYKAQSGGIQEPGVAEADPAGVDTAGSGNSAGESSSAGSTSGTTGGSSNAATSAADGSTGGTAGSNTGSGSNAADEVDGSAAGEGEAGGAGSSTSSPALQFTDETVVITVDENTEYVVKSGTGETGSSSEAAAGALTLADLQAGDVLTVTLTEGTLTASRIELQSGFVAGGGGLTAAPDASASPLPLPGPGDDVKPQQTPAGHPDGQAAPPQDGKAGERPAGGPDGGPAGGAPGGDAPAGARGGAAGGAAPGSAGGAPAGAPDKPGAAAGAKPAATPAAGAKPAASTSPAPSASAGASSKPAADAKPAATPAAGAKPAAADGGGSGGRTPGAAMSFGKIKSISGSKITLYTAEAPSAAPQDGAADAGGPQGAEPSGRPSAEPGAGGGQGSGGQGGRPQRQGGAQMSFSEETTVITVTSDTKLISITFTDGKRTEATIALSTLKAGDIIQYTLKSGTAQADSISLSSGDSGSK
ncbi:hypothetical protein GC101_03660 [Paenibacillus sp. LMG 31459]|uniref:DUF5666 domain-containing protein n=1 Tax=Paenibacillus phytohabitans TaxID=2654978 RepID=A0ABX1YD88_9BACL|nr:hypothetical protein [Paenibacillus phytohabitans]NOU77971.1 hypothetical protein [Paenibacillus phytohabitans]